MLKRTQKFVSTSTPSIGGIKRTTGVQIFKELWNIVVQASRLRNREKKGKERTSAKQDINQKKERIERNREKRTNRKKNTSGYNRILNRRSVSPIQI
jgi:hypothetical protein